MADRARTAADGALTELTNMDGREAEVAHLHALRAVAFALLAVDARLEAISDTLEQARP